MTKTILTEAKIGKLLRERKEREVRDGGEPGLILRIRVPASRASEDGEPQPATAQWSFKYRRPGDGKQVRLALGTYRDGASEKTSRAALSLVQARKAVVEARADVANGRDPVGAKEAKARAAEERISEQAKELTVTAMLELWLKQKSGLRTNADDKGLFRTDVIAPKGEPAPLGAMRLSAVTKRDIARVVDRCIARGSPVTATRLLNRIKAAMRWAVSRGYIASNPCDGVGAPVKYSDRARERVLDVQEIRAFFATLPHAITDVAHQRILHLQLLLGQRLGEIAGMRKRELDLDGYLWTIPGSRTKNQRDHAVPLPPEARAIIVAAIADADRPALEHPEAAKFYQTEFVFPGEKPSEPVLIGSIGQALRRVQHLEEPDDRPVSKHRPKSLPPRVVFGFMHPQTGQPNPFTSHDLRRTLATQCEKLGIGLRVISKLLNHTEAKSVTDKVYAHAELMPERFRALVQWEKALREIRDGGDPFASSKTDFRQIEADELGASGPVLRIVKAA